MFLIVGLGNPGGEYAGTRHNAGFMAVDRFVSLQGAKFTGKRDGYEYAELSVSGREVVVIRPVTYMNRSGFAVKSAAARYGAEVQTILVVQDDCDLEFGKIKLRKKGRSGGQKGIASIIEALGTEEFARLKIGIGKPSSGELSDYVLSRFTKDEVAVLGQLMDRAVEAISAFMELGIDNAMNKCNS